MEINTILQLLKEQKIVCEVHYSSPISYDRVVHARIDEIDDDYVSFLKQSHGSFQVVKIIIESQKVTFIMEV